MRPPLNYKVHEPPFREVDIGHLHRAHSRMPQNDEVSIQVDSERVTKRAVGSASVLHCASDYSVIIDEGKGGGGNGGDAQVARAFRKPASDVDVFSPRVCVRMARAVWANGQKDDVRSGTTDRVDERAHDARDTSLRDRHQ